MNLRLRFLAFFSVSIIKAAAFVILQSKSGRRLDTTLRAAQKRPVVVVARDTEAARTATLGAAWGLCIRDVLLQQQDTTNDAIPAAQPVILLTPSADGLQEVLKDVCEKPPVVTNNKEYLSIEDYEYVLRSYNHDNDEPIVHVVLGEPNPELLEPQIRNSISFLGLEPIVVQEDANGRVSPEIAHRIGSVLQQILDIHTEGEVSIAWDWPLHLAMLQANCLPKSSAHGDLYLILPAAESSATMNNDDVVVVDYLYDYDNPFGGTDPLSCPTREVSIDAQSENYYWTRAMNHAAAAAYTACRGNGMEPVNAACIASSVGAMMASEQPYTWPTVERSAQLCWQLRDNIREGPIVRKKYIEFGYK